MLSSCAATINVRPAGSRSACTFDGGAALDAPGLAFHDPAARTALFRALEDTVRQTAGRQLIRLPHNINDPEFAAAVVAAFLSLHEGPRPVRRRDTRR